MAEVMACGQSSRNLHPKPTKDDRIPKGKNLVELENFTPLLEIAFALNLIIFALLDQHKKIRRELADILVDLLDDEFKKKYERDFLRANAIKIYPYFKYISYAFYTNTVLAFLGLSISLISLVLHALYTEIQFHWLIVPVFVLLFIVITPSFEIVLRRYSDRIAKLAATQAEVSENTVPAVSALQLITKLDFHFSISRKDIKELKADYKAAMWKRRLKQGKKFIYQFLETYRFVKRYREFQLDFALGRYQVPK